MNRLLEQRDRVSLNKFLAYGKSADEEVNPRKIPGPSGDLAEVEISKQSYVGLGDH
ncbi:hypothetical protein [Wolbachia endosymbiont (group B) of Gerris lacustris]|uniref:hypothetical protein n=1 Tax=Wolbachia endosymbiont (group B) of Gerris lacustris TaxID=3066159 RepID=UPI0033408A7A